MLHLDEIFKNGKGSKSQERPEGYWDEPLIIDSSVIRPVIIRALTVDSWLDKTQEEERERESVRFRSIASVLSLLCTVEITMHPVVLHIPPPFPPSSSPTAPSSSASYVQYKHRHTSPFFSWLFYDLVSFIERRTPSHSEELPKSLPLCSLSWLSLRTCTCTVF